MFERRVPMPFPEGDHGQVPEGSKDRLNPLEKFHRAAMQIHELDPNMIVKKIGHIRFDPITDEMSPIYVVGEIHRPSSEYAHEYSITIEDVLPNGNGLPIGQMFIDSNGILKRDMQLSLYNQMQDELDSMDRTSTQSIDPLTGEPMPSEERTRIEEYLMADMDAEMDFIDETGYATVSDEEAVSFLRDLQGILPHHWPESAGLPDKTGNGAPQEQTVDAFRKFTTAIANKKIIRTSYLDDQNGNTFVVNTESTISADGQEIPLKVEASDTVRESSPELVVDTTTVWEAKRHTPVTAGSYDQVISMPSRERTEDQFLLRIQTNKAALRAHDAYMKSDDAIATDEQEARGMQVLRDNAEKLQQAQSSQKDSGPETSALHTVTGQVDVIVFQDDSGIPAQEPQVGGSVNQSIAEQEKHKPDDPTDFQHPKGKSK